MYITKIQTTINVRETEGESGMYITKIQATINVRETEGAIMNVHYKDTGNTGHKTQNEDKQNKNITLKTINMRRTS